MQTSDIPLWALFVVGLSQRAFHVLHSSTHSPLTLYQKTTPITHIGSVHRERRNVCTMYMRLVFVLLFYFSKTSDYESVHDTQKNRQ